MSEQTGAPATGAPQNDPPADPKAATQAPPEGVAADAWAALGDKGKAALVAEREARAAAEKAAAELRTKLDEDAKANLTDLERAKQEAQEAKEAAATAATEATRYRLAAKHGLSEEDAKFLTGTEAQMQALAQRLAAANAPRNPLPDPSQAGQGKPPALNSNGLERALKDKLGIA